MPKLGIAPRLPRPQRGVLLLDYFGGSRQLEDPGIDPGSQPCEGCMLPCTTIPQSNCVHRDSNPNLILGRDKYYPCTMDACYHDFSQNTNLKCCKVCQKKNISGEGDLNSRPKDHREG